MKILRNIAKGLSLLFFSISLALLILIFFFHNLTNYENAKNLFTAIFKEVATRKVGGEEKIEEFHAFLIKYCSLNENESVEVFNNFTLECSEILNKNSTQLVYLISEKFFNQLYYKTYDCEMPECIKEIKSGEDIVVLLSLKSHEFLDKIFKYLLILVIVFGFLLFISLETWEGRLKTFGFEFLSIGIFYIFLPYFKKFILEKFLKEIPVGEYLLNLIFDKLTSILLILFLLGLSLVCGWIFIKLSKKSK